MAYDLTFNPKGRSTLKSEGPPGTHRWRVCRSSDGSVSLEVGMNLVVLDDEQSAALKMILNGGN